MQKWNFWNPVAKFDIDPVVHVGMAACSNLQSIGKVVNLKAATGSLWCLGLEK